MSPEHSDLRAALASERARVNSLQALLTHIATVAHHGGVSNMNEHDALVAIRRLTLEHMPRRVPLDVR